nr:MAG TPA: hypothetical protein [Caudoviricetes sp.]
MAFSISFACVMSRPSRSLIAFRVCRPDCGCNSRDLRLRYAVQLRELLVVFLARRPIAELPVRDAGHVHKRLFCDLLARQPRISAEFFQCQSFHSPFHNELSLTAAGKCATLLLALCGNLKEVVF